MASAKLYKSTFPDRAFWLFIRIMRIIGPTILPSFTYLTQNIKIKIQINTSLLKMFLKTITYCICIKNKGMNKEMKEWKERKEQYL